MHLATNPFNEYGYAIELDVQGHYEENTFDYEALTAHIVALHKAAQAHGADIWRVIFDRKLAPNL